MNVLVVDDEEAARGRLCKMLTRQSGVEILDQAANGLEAIEKVNALHPDLLFLDVRMPVLSGFDILPYLEDPPPIVFCTAYEEYAIHAFEANAVDYLLKPVKEERLKAFFDKLGDRRKTLARLDGLANEGAKLEKIVCRTQRSRHVVWLHEIVAFHKEGRYTNVVTDSGKSHLTDLTLNYLHDNLPQNTFYRINRGAIISRSNVRTLQTQPTGNGLLLTRDEQSFTVSRGRITAFRNWLEEPGASATET